MFGGRAFRGALGVLATVVVAVVPVRADAEIGEGGLTAPAVAANAALASAAPAAGTVVHVPVATARIGESFAVTAEAVCASADCAMQLSYRTPTDETDSLTADASQWTALAPHTVTDLGPLSDTFRRGFAFEVPASAVGAAGIDYFLRLNDGARAFFSPGTEDTRLAHYHVSVVKGQLVSHVPPFPVYADQPLSIRAEVRCPEGLDDCDVVLGYRVPDGNPLGVAANSGSFHVGRANETPFTEETMEAAEVVPGEPAAAVFTATVPATAVRTQGLDYYIVATDSQGGAAWPGSTSYTSPQALEGRAYYRAFVAAPAWVSHVPPPAAAVAQPVALRFAANCPATRQCDATVWFRSSPTQAEAGPVTAADRVMLTGEPAWARAFVRRTTVTPNGSQQSVAAYEAEIPATAVTSRGFDYLVKVTDGDTSHYWPTPPPNPVTVGGDPVLVAHHVAVASPPVIAHAPHLAVRAGQTVTLEWAFACSTPSTAACTTRAFHRAAPSATALLATPYAELPVTTRVTSLQPGYHVVEATASFAAAATTGAFDQYYLEASDGTSSSFAPGTPYEGTTGVDGTNGSGLAAYTALVVP